MSQEAFRPAKVSKELANAAYDDFKRKAIDEAKKRAVSQRVDYDTFKNMVLTAHLKPITAPNKRSDDRPLPCWNFGVDGKLLKEHVGQANLPPTTPTEMPSTSGDFYRDWRRNCPSPDDKYRYLKLCGPEGVRAVFRVEVNSEVLRELLGVVEACWLGHAGAAEEADAGSGAALAEAAFVVQLLDALAAAGRFSLTLKLLGSGVRPVLESLFAGLAAAVAAAAGHAAGEDQNEHSPPGREQAPAQEQGQAPGVMCSAEQLSALRAVYGLPS